MSGQPITRNLITVLAATVVALAIAGYWLHASGSLGSLAGEGYAVRVAAPSSAGLATGTSVRMAGLPIGRVGSIERTSSGARITLKINDKYAPLPRDSSATLQLRTLVGETYVSVVRGRAGGDIPDGGDLPLERGSEYVEVDQILSVLRGKTRARARATLRGLQKGLRGRGSELNAVVDDAAGFVSESVPVVDVLHRDRQQVARLIENLGSVTRSVAARGTSLRGAARDARTTFASIAASDEAVRSMLAELPGTMRQARRTSDTLRRVSATATPTIAHLAGTVRALGPSVRQLRPTAATARVAVRELDAAAPPLTRTVGELRRLSGPASKALPALRRVLCEVNPALDYLSPYAKDIPTVLQSLGSTTNFYDATGHAARLFFTAGTNSLGAFTPETAQMVDTLLSTGLVGRSNPQRGYDPLPKPGAVGELTQGLGASGPADVKERYPRIKAAC